MNAGSAGDSQQEGRREGARLGLLGGTFDPPHLAHLELAEAARRTLRLDRVVFVPAGDPWRKRDREVSPAEHRLEMVRVATADLPWVEVSAVDVERDGDTYTVDTLEALVGPGEQWWFIIGADALADMPYWYEPDRILEYGRLAVAHRPGSPPPQVTDRLRQAMPGVDERIDLVDMEPHDISATEIRRRVRAGESTDDLVPRAVRVVIDRLGLYRDDAGTESSER